MSDHRSAKTYVFMCWGQSRPRRPPNGVIRKLKEIGAGAIVLQKKFKCPSWAQDDGDIGHFSALGKGHVRKGVFQRCVFLFGQRAEEDRRVSDVFGTASYVLSKLNKELRIQWYKPTGRTSFCSLAHWLSFMTWEPNGSCHLNIWARFPGPCLTVKATANRSFRQRRPMSNLCTWHMIATFLKFLLSTDFSSIMDSEVKTKFLSVVVQRTMEKVLSTVAGSITIENLTSHRITEI